MQPLAVVFDIGNVLIEWQPERYYDRQIGEARRRDLFATVDLHGMQDRVDKGEPFRDLVYATAEAHPDWQGEIRMWHDNWADLAAPAIDRSVRLLRALRRRRIPVFALTNFGAESFALSRPRYPFLEEFDRLYVSGELGLIKPDPAIYAALEADCGVAPERLIFTDDRLDNIAVAHARGWQVHHFDGPEGWARCLVEKGLLTPGDAE